MTLPRGLGVVSVMAAPFLLSWLRLATTSSARFGAASPTQLCERFCTSSPYEARTKELAGNFPDLAELVELLLIVRRALSEQIAIPPFARHRAGR